MLPSAMAAAAAGGAPEQLAQLTIYLVDMDDYRAHLGAIGTRWRSRMCPHHPATAAVQVARLWDAEALVEVQGLAVLP